MTDDKDSSVLIDREFFESRRQVGEDFLDKLIEVFSKEAPKLIKKIKKLKADESGSELADSGHKLKGMCLNVGAQSLSALGEKIELTAKEGKIETLDDVIAELDSVLLNTLSELKKLGS